MPRSLPEDYGQLTESRDVAALTKGGRDLAGGLRLQVIAEGIETAAQAESLREMSCDFGRGFHFAKPLEASALEQLLRRAAPAGRR